MGDTFHDFSETPLRFDLMIRKFRYRKRVERHRVRIDASRTIKELYRRVALTYPDITDTDVYLTKYQKTPLGRREVPLGIHYEGLKVRDPYTDRGADPEFVSADGVAITK